MKLEIAGTLCIVCGVLALWYVAVGSYWMAGLFTLVTIGLFIAIVKEEHARDSY